MISNDMGQKNENLIRFMDTGKIGWTDEEYDEYLVS